MNSEQVEIIGYVNPNYYYPSPVIIVAKKNKEYIAIYPSGYECKINDFSKYNYKINANFIEEKRHRKYYDNLFGFALNKDEVLLDKPRTMNKILSQLLNDKKISSEFSKSIYDYLNSEKVNVKRNLVKEKLFEKKLPNYLETEYKSQKLYVGSLPWVVNDYALSSIFENHGKVKAVKIIRDGKTGRSKGFGFVKMQDATSARKAVFALNGKGIRGSNIVVSPFTPPIQSSSERLFIGALPTNVNAKAIRNAIGKFVNISSVKVIKDSKTGKSRGYGFVELTNSSDMKSAILALKGIKIKDRNIIVCDEKELNI